MMNPLENPQNEIAYWKSKAVSLEYENKMLHKHIKHMYTNTINQYYSQDNFEQTEEYFDDPDIQEEKTCENIDTKNIDIKNTDIKNIDIKRKKSLKKRDDDLEESQPPNNEDVKNRETEMKILYGNDWRKILGMETCVQLNFDLFVEKGKATFWPVLPIKL